MIGYFDIKIIYKHNFTVIKEEYKLNFDIPQSSCIYKKKQILSRIFVFASFFL